MTAIREQRARDASTHAAFADDCSGLALAPVWNMQSDLGAATRTWDDITSLVDHVVHRCHPTTRRALAEARACADARVKAAVEAFAQSVEEQLAAEEKLLKTVRALAEARAGRGPFPPPPFIAVHAHGSRVGHAHVRLDETLRHIRALAERSNKATTRALDALASALAEHARLVTTELLPWARGLEPDREHANHRATKRGAHANARRRANEIHKREPFAGARDFIHRKRA